MTRQAAHGPLAPGVSRDVRPAVTTDRPSRAEWPVCPDRRRSSTSPTIPRTAAWPAPWSGRAHVFLRSHARASPWLGRHARQPGGGCEVTLAGRSNDHTVAHSETAKAIVGAGDSASTAAGDAGSPDRACACPKGGVGTRRPGIRSRANRASACGPVTPSSVGSNRAASPGASPSRVVTLR